MYFLLATPHNLSQLPRMKFLKQHEESQIQNLLQGEEQCYHHKNTVFSN